MDSAIGKAMQTVRPLIDQRSHTISLATARDKELLQGFRQCDYIEIDSISSGAACQLRFNSLNNPEYESNKYRRFKTTPEMPFKKLYLTNTAQAGKTLVLKCGGDATMIAERESAISEIVNPIALKDSAGTTINPVSESENPTIYNVVMTNADTEYSQALPAGTKKFSLKMRQIDTAFRIAYVAGKVAAPTEPYYTIPITGEYYEDKLNLAAVTIYFACASAGKTIEITVWT